MARLIILISVFLFSCTYEKDIQVQAEIWTLIKKQHAERWYDQDFTFLVWQDERGIIFKEKVKDEEAGRYLIGFKTVNRVTR